MHASIQRTQGLRTRRSAPVGGSAPAGLFCQEGGEEGSASRPARSFARTPPRPGTLLQLAANIAARSAALRLQQLVLRALALFADREEVGRDRAPRDPDP